MKQIRWSLTCNEVYINTSSAIVSGSSGNICQDACRHVGCLVFIEQKLCIYLIILLICTINIKLINSKHYNICI